jgi:uncharacterized protein (TIRG00374 family)
MNRRLRSLMVWGGVAISLLFTYIAVKDVDAGVFLDGLRQSNYAWIAPSLAVLAVAVFLRALRWGYLFTPETRPPVRALLSALLIGYLFNNIMPARAGEAIRVFVLHQREDTSRFEALATAATERVFDTLCLLVLLFVALPFLPEVTWIQNAAILAAVTLAGVLAVIVVVARYGARPVARLLRPLSRTPGISVALTEQAAESAVRGLAGIRRPRLAVTAFALTLVSWLVIATSFWLLTLAFGLHVGFGAGLLVAIAVNLAMILPSSPAGLGLWEAATQAALAAYGIGPSEALAYAVVLHGLNFFPYVLLGYLALHHHSARMRRAHLFPAERGDVFEVAKADPEPVS